jgi:hypothetical protein
MGRKAFKHPFIRKKSLIIVVKGGRALRSSRALGRTSNKPFSFEEILSV